MTTETMPITADNLRTDLQAAKSLYYRDVIDVQEQAQRYGLGEVVMVDGVFEFVERREAAREAHSAAPSPRPLQERPTTDSNGQACPACGSCSAKPGPCHECLECGYRGGCG